LDDHINGHNYLLERLNAFSIEIGHGHFNKADLVKLMTDWAMNHIVRNDIPALAFITKIKIDPLANAVPSAPAAKVNALHRQPFRGIPTRVPL
jgi:hemerythrin